MKYVVKMDYCTMALLLVLARFKLFLIAWLVILICIGCRFIIRKRVHIILLSAFCFKPPCRGRPMVYDSVFRVKFRGFRRFYDFFLRRKHLESLVRVIRPFGVHMCATKAKKFSGLTFSPAGL